MCNAVSPRGSKRIFKKIDDMGKTGLGRPRNDEHTGSCKKGGSSVRLDFTPYLMGAARHRRQMLPFADRFTGYSRVAVGRTERMGRRVAVDAEYAGLAASELVNGGAADRTQPQHSNIKRVHSSTVG